MAFDGHQDMPERQQDAAEQHRLAHAEVAVGDQAADHGQGIYQTGISAEHVEAHFIGKEVVLRQVQEQQELHSVE